VEGGGGGLVDGHAHGAGTGRKKQYKHKGLEPNGQRRQATTIAAPATRDVPSESVASLGAPQDGVFGNCISGRRVWSEAVIFCKCEIEDIRMQGWKVDGKEG
jgi:hypothetical protein